MRQRKLLLCMIAVAMLIILAACATKVTPENSSTATSVPASSSEVLSSQGSGTSEPPASQTPDSQTPDTQNPATQPPATQTPATQTPASQPPATQTPATQPTATQAPATQPPTTDTPETTPPETVPPATENVYVAPTNYKEYLALTGEHQVIFINSFNSPADFAAWLKNAKEIHDQENDKTYVDGDTVVDLEKGDK